MRYKKFQKNSKKIQKINKIPLWLHFKPKSVERGGEREKIKIIVSFRPYLARNRKCQKKAKKFKKLKHSIMASFQAKIVWKRPRKKENKSYRFVPLQPDAL